jgi:hypothetical protein
MDVERRVRHDADLREAVIAEHGRLRVSAE